MRSCSAARARSASAAGPRPEHPRTARPFFLARSARCLWKVPRPSDASRIGACFDWKNTGVARSVASAAPRVRLGRPFAGASADLPRVAALGLDVEASSDSEDLDSGSDMSDVEEIIEVSEDELDPSERMLVVLTREDGKNADMQALLEQFGIDSLVLPLIRTEELPAALELPAAVRGLPSGSWICLTSAIAALTLCAHALEPLAERWAREELRVAVVGVATGRALEQHSGGRVIADFVPTIANAKTMGAELPLYDAPARSEGSEKDAPAASESSGGMSGEAGNKNLEDATSSSSGRRECSSYSASTLPGFSSESAPESAPHVLFPASRLALGLLERILEERGAVVRRMEVYGTVPQVVDDPELVQRASIADAVVLASPSAAKAWVAAVGPDAALQVPAACIGSTTAEAAREAGVGVVVAPDQPGQGAVMELLVGGMPGAGEAVPQNRAAEEGTEVPQTPGKSDHASATSKPGTAGVFLPTLGTQDVVKDD